MNFKSDSLDWALAHILRHGDTDIFPIPFEYDAIRSLWKADGGVRTWLLKQDPLEWKTRALRRCLVPKHRYGFRPSTQLDPLDTIAYTALVYDLGKDIEKHRLPVAQGIVHSYRFKPTADGQLYDPKCGWTSFRRKSHDLVKTGLYQYVVLADIADFFPRLYSHPLENELVACTAQRKSTAKAILGLFKQWNQTKSYGIPVGPAASRLVSELALTLIDDALKGRGTVYVRFSDDFRIFCKDFREAHEQLAFLAHSLFEALGLTLQQHKTRIVTEAEFRRILLSPRRQERTRLSEQFDALIDALGLQDPYKKIDYDKLSPAKKEQVDALNLGQILEAQIELRDDLDIPVTAFVLRRLAQLQDKNHLDLVVDHLDALYPVFQDAVRYVAMADDVHGNRRRAIGGKLLKSIDATISGHLEFHRCWLLNVFAQSSAWNNESLLAALESRWSDVFTVRELILARGRAGHRAFFKNNRHGVDNLGPWERRAFLYAASCLPGDEANHWWDGMKKSGNLDPVDRAIMAYGKNHAIASN